MTPAEVFTAALYLCGAAVLVVVTLAVCGVAVVFGLLAAGKVVTLFKADATAGPAKPGVPSVTYGVYPNGERKVLMHFENGGVAEVPAPSTPDE